MAACAGWRMWRLPLRCCYCAWEVKMRGRLGLVWSCFSDILSPVGPGHQMWHFQCDSDLEDQCLHVLSYVFKTCRTPCLETVEEEHRCRRLSYCREPGRICHRQQHLHVNHHHTRSCWWRGRQETQGFKASLG